MAKILRYAIASSRVLLVAVCLPVLLASLVLWPRSRFYVDQLMIAVDDKPPTMRWGSTPPRLWYHLNAIQVMSAFGTLRWTGPGDTQVSGPHVARPYEHSSTRSPTGLGWKPEIRWRQNGHSNTLSVVAPYWLTTTLSLAGIAIAFPKSVLLLFSWRIGILALLLLTLSVAIVIYLYQFLGDGGVVLGIEAIALGWISHKAFMAAGRADGWRKGGAYAAAVLCSMGVLAVAAFTLHVTSVAAQSPTRFFLH